jgi:hypothetical protein
MIPLYTSISWKKLGNLVELFAHALFGLSGKLRRFWSLGFYYESLNFEQVIVRGDPLLPMDATPYVQKLEFKLEYQCESWLFRVAAGIQSLNISMMNLWNFEQVIVRGDPLLPVDATTNRSVERFARYIGGSGSETLIFRYTVRLNLKDYICVYCTHTQINK